MAQLTLEEVQRELEQRSSAPQLTLEEVQAELESRKPPEEPDSFLSNVGSSFLRNQPVQNPLRIAREVNEQGPVGFVKGMLGGQLDTLKSGLGAVFDPRGPVDVTGRLARSANIGLGMLPVFGAGISQETVEPLAKALSTQEPERPRSALLGEAVGGAAGIVSGILADVALGGASKAALARGRGALAARRTGITETAAQRVHPVTGKPAGSITRGIESVVSRLPGGRNVIERAKNLQQVQIVENGINKVLDSMARFTGRKSELVHRIQNGVNDVIENLKVRNNALYEQFDRAFPHFRILGGDADAANIKAGAGFAIDTTPIADIADTLVVQLQKEQSLLRDPALGNLIGKVEGIAASRGQFISIADATSGRSTLLELARRMDNPLPGKEGRLVNAIFDPIDGAIEIALRDVGGEKLVSRWRVANGAVKRTHEVVDETLFSQVSQMRNPEDIASVVRAAPQADLRRLKFHLGKDAPGRWDQVRTLIARDEFAKQVKGESAAVQGRTGTPLRITLDEGATVKVSGNLTEAINTIEETRRGVLFKDSEIAAVREIENVRGRASAADSIATLVGSSLAADRVVKFGAAGLALGGGLLAGGASATGLGIAAGGLLGMISTSWVAAHFLTKPFLMDFLRAGAAAGTLASTSGLVAQEILNGLPDEALAGFIEANNIPSSELSPEIQQRISAGPPVGPQAIPGFGRNPAVPLGVAGQR